MHSLILPAAPIVNSLSMHGCLPLPARLIAGQRDGIDLLHGRTGGALAGASPREFQYCVSWVGIVVFWERIWVERLVEQGARPKIYPAS